MVSLLIIELLIIEVHSQIPALLGHPGGVGDGS